MEFLNEIKGAKRVIYDNMDSNLEASQLQDAVDELDEKKINIQLSATQPSNQKQNDIWYEII